MNSQRLATPRPGLNGASSPRTSASGRLCTVVQLPPCQELADNKHSSSSPKQQGHEECDQGPVQMCEEDGEGEENRPEEIVISEGGSGGESDEDDGLVCRCVVVLCALACVTACVALVCRCACMRALCACIAYVHWCVCVCARARRACVCV